MYDVLALCNLFEARSNGTIRYCSTIGSLPGPRLFYVITPNNSILWRERSGQLMRLYTTCKLTSCSSLLSCEISFSALIILTELHFNNLSSASSSTAYNAWLMHIKWFCTQQSCGPTTEGRATWLTGVMPSRPYLLARANPLCGSPSLIPSKLSWVDQGFIEETWELSAMVRFTAKTRKPGNGRHCTTTASADSA